MAKRIRILVVDDHPIVREGLRTVILQSPELELVAEASNADEAMQLVVALGPDAVLVDISLPGASGLDLTRRIKEARPDTAVVILTMYDNENYFIEAIQAGANGYLLKDQAHGLVRSAVQAALEGGAVVQQELLRRMMRSMVPRSMAPAVDLTARELSVLALLAKGHSNRGMAQALSLAEVTVKKHIQSLMGKLGTSDRTQTALMAVRMRLVE